MQSITFKQMQAIAINGLAFVGSTPNTKFDLSKVFELLSSENTPEKISCTPTSKGFKRGESYYIRTTGDKFYRNDTHLVIHSPGSDTYICYAI